MPVPWSIVVLIPTMQSVLVLFALARLELRNAGASCHWLICRVFRRIAR